MQPLKEDINALYQESDELVKSVCETTQDDCDLIYVMTTKEVLYVLLNGKVVDK